MDTSYWNLFWRTGMPEAWLMGRDMGAVPPPDAEQGAVQESDSPVAAPIAAPMGIVPGNLGNLY